MNKKYLDEKIRRVPDFPKPGIQFYDISTILEDREAWQQLIDELCKPYRNQAIDKIVGIDARGFLLAAAMAYKLNTGLSLIRKKGKLPYKTKEASYKKEYGHDIIEMHVGTIKPGENVLIVDDLLATGGTMLASINLVEQTKGKIIGIEFIINLSFLSGLEKIKVKGYPIHYLISYDNENTK